jgi:hypothetical protein
LFAEYAILRTLNPLEIVTLQTPKEVLQMREHQIIQASTSNPIMIGEDFEAPTS